MGTHLLKLPKGLTHCFADYLCELLYMGMGITRLSISKQFMGIFTSREAICPERRLTHARVIIGLGQAEQFSITLFRPKESKTSYGC